MKKKFYVLRQNNKNNRSRYNTFQYPNKGTVVAPDWNPAPFCGGGLHGFLNGCGAGHFGDYAPENKWLVIETSEVVDLAGKVKFEKGEVLFCGTLAKAIEKLEQLNPTTESMSVVGATRTAGYAGTATAGDYGTATAGYAGTATAGDYGTATAGDYGTATAGYAGTATAGYAGTATAGGLGTANAGERGTANAGERGTATAGERGTANAGERGTATAGYAGTATAGERGTATAGERGQIRITYWDDERFRVVVGYVGGDGIEPNVKYKLSEERELVKA